MIAARIRTSRTAILLPALLLAACMALAGCAGPSRESPISEWKVEQGEAFRAQRDAQTLNPGPADDDPVVGLDGRVAERAMKTMREGEKKPDDSNAVRLKIGTK
ncbi:hypothetical protein RVX_R24790 [Nitratidesulfovibrio sp. HK-II]|uniref:hypothetical protein n=1 Tax=Nitratidesulfovibrio sp. HK-II TaxID=2009266 RepID=UPI000E2FBC73|nr:hypothetical protein [Nitratidesulfovibrio sp. HK-II]GBO96857.1 hypothetical protein RVX_1896 [Nitratidesulfovibrio sp. HK-II]